MTAAVAEPSPDELALRLAQQELVAGFGLFALKAGSIERLLAEACRVAAAGLRVRFSKVLQRNPGSDELLVVAGVGWHKGVIGHRTVGGGLNSPAGHALHTGLPTVSNNLATEERFRTTSLLLEHGIQSAINVVIGQADRDPYGVLEVDSTARFAFIEPDTAFLQALANVLAAGMARAAAQDLADGLLRDKDLLLKEVHHRVGNSLQLVRTVLAMQARNASSGARVELDAAAGRIMSIAAVHRRLYEGGSVQEADAVTYLRALLDDLGELLGEPSRGRTLELEANPLQLAADTLTPLGLIVCELVTNAIKYGAGRVLVRVARVAAGLRIVVEDEGDGFGPMAAEAGRQGLGMRLVRSLARGNPASAVEIDRDAGHGRITVILSTS